MFSSNNIVVLSFILSIGLLLSSCKTAEQRLRAEASCYQGNLADCDKETLCALASGYKGEFGLFSSTPNGPKVWKPGMKKFGDEARNRGYSCGVKSK